MRNFDMKICKNYFYLFFEGRKKARMTKDYPEIINYFDFRIDINI